MKIKYNPAVDLCCAMLRYAHWDEFISMITPGYTLSSELEDWYRMTRQSVSGVLDNDINYLVRNFCGLIFLPIEFALDEGISEFPKLLKAFINIPPESLPELLFSTYATDIPFNKVRNDPDGIIRALEKAGATTRKKEPQLFLDFLRTPAVFQTRLIGMMEEFYEAAVKPYEKDVIVQIEEQIKQEQKILDIDPARFFNGFLKIKYDEKDFDTQIYISYYNEIDIIQLDNPQSIIYGRARCRLEGNSSIPVEVIYKLLSDDSRRIILQLLCRKSWFIRELADELDLTSATVSYHMSKLTALNLVTFERGERKRIYYCANRNVVSEMLETIKKDILGQ